MLNYLRVFRHRHHVKTSVDQQLPFFGAFNFMSTLVKSSTLAASILGLLSLSTVLVAAPSQAAVVNGSFESGLNGWTSTGFVLVIDNTIGAAPTNGNFQAVLSTYPSTVSATSLEGFLGLSAGSLNGLNKGAVTRGSAIKQTFTANAGDVVSFDWNFLTTEATPNPGYNDFAFASLTGLTELADTSSTTFVNSLTPFREETGYQTASYTIATGGTYTLGIGVADVGDQAVTSIFGEIPVPSGLLVDNVSSEPVPEPASMLGILAFGALGGKKLLKRKQQKQA